MSKELKDLQHLTIQIAVSVYSDQVLGQDVKSILSRVGQRFSQQLQNQVDDSLALELTGEPGEDWTTSRYADTYEHFHRLMIGLIHTGRCDGLRYALTFLECYRAAVQTPPDLDYLIHRLNEELEKEQKR